jgi:hypothetical protein
VNGSIISYLTSGALTIGVTVAGLAPKLASFNQSSQGHLDAIAAAETCQVLEQVNEGIKPIYAPTKAGLAPGAYLCDAMGNTAQVQPNGLLGPVSTGQPEIIRKKLTDRGWQFSATTTQQGAATR